MPVYRSQFEKIVAVKMAQDGVVFKNETKSLPLFNGTTEKNLDSFFLYLSKLNYIFDKKLNL